MSLRPVSCHAIVLLMSLVLAGTVRSEPNQDDLSVLRAEVLELRQKVLEAKAEKAVLIREKAFLEADRLVAVQTVPTNWNLITDGNEQLRNLLKRDHQSLDKELTSLSTTAKQDRNTAITAWKKASEQTLITESKLREWEEHQREVRGSGFWNWFTFLLFGLALFVVGLGVSLTLHERRLAYRRLFRGFSVLALGVMLLPTTALAQEITGDVITDWTAERTRLKAELTTLQSEVEELREQVKKQRDKIRDDWAARLPAPHRDEFARDQDAIYEKLHSYLINTEVAARASSEGKERVAEAVELRQALIAAESGTEGDWLQRFLIRIGLIVGAALLSFGLVYTTKRRERKKAEAAAELCPRCNAKCNPTSKSVVQDDRYATPVSLQCDRCDYKFPPEYKEFTRISLPFVGVYGSGKTHTIVTLYDQVKRDRIQSTSEIRPAIYDKGIEEDFDTLVKTILTNRGRPQPTRFLLPSPLTLYLRDQDKWGANPVLVNLFDYSGELMEQDIDTDVLRRWALMMDGFVLFFDPTQVDDDDPDGMNLDQQAAALTKFYDDMRRIRGLKVSRRIDVPIAVCIPKIDLLISRNPMEESAEPFLEKLRATQFKTPTLSLIQKRSRLVEKILPNMFPGYDLRRSLRGYFGVRHMFFPLSPIGIEDGGQGKTGLQNIVPFGIAEPLLWLMHMKGYQVLPE